MKGLPDIPLGITHHHHRFLAALKTAVEQSSTGVVAGTGGQTWYFGVGAPASTIGIDGDFYLDTQNVIIYNKQSGSFVPLVDLSGVAYLAHVETFTKAQSGAFVNLTSTGGSVAINLDDGNNFAHTLTENTTLAAPTGSGWPTKSEPGIFYVKQHASAGKTFAFDTFWKFTTAFSMTTLLGSYSAFSFTTRPDGSAVDCVQFL